MAAVGGNPASSEERNMKDKYDNRDAVALTVLVCVVGAIVSLAFLLVVLR